MCFRIQNHLNILITFRAILAISLLLVTWLIIGWSISCQSPAPVSPAPAPGPTEEQTPGTPVSPAPTPSLTEEPAPEAPPAPAAFTTSSLSISPTEVNVGEKVTIGVRLTNTGDLSGSYEVTLKIDNVVVETRQVTLVGGASQTVTFTAAKDAAGTYTVNINGLSGAFTVKTPSATPPPIEVAIEGFTFKPVEITIPVGGTVIWQHKDSAPHTVTAQDGTFDSASLSRGNSFSYTFQQKGTFEYYCRFHPYMKGKVIVE